MEAAEGVLDELALPRVHGGSCVGVLNVESRQAMPDADVDDLAQAAQVLAVALSADSGPPVESASWPRRARRRRPCARCVTASSHRRSPVSRPAAAAG